MTDFTAARLNMVESQVRPNGITDRRIIAAIERVPREIFVPESRRAVAYMDEDVPLEPADTSRGPRALIEVMAFARMLQHAAIKPADKVLVVGAGTGYGAAVIAMLGRHTVALECDPGLAAAARANLEGTAGVAVVEGELEAGVAGEQPFDVILAEGRVEEVPQALARPAGRWRTPGRGGGRGGHGAGLHLHQIGLGRCRAAGLRCLGGGAAGIEEEETGLRVLSGVVLRRAMALELEW